jgi:site-specific DNA-adenine methylase
MKSIIMDLNKIKIQLDKYLRAETSDAEENELRDYFSSSDVPPSLEQYKPIFSNLTLEKRQQFNQEIQLKSRNRNWLWLSVAASVVVLLGIGTFGYINYFNEDQNQNLGTYDDPEIAFRETQKALSKLSINLNTGFESMQYIKEYENSKNLIFKQ